MATATESSLLASLLKQPSYAERLAQQASSTAPNPSWGAGIAQALMGGLAGVYEGQDDAQNKLAAKVAGGLIPIPGQSAPSGLAAALGGGSAQPAMQPSPAPPPNQRLATALTGPSPSPAPPAPMGPMPDSFPNRSGYSQNDKIISAVPQGEGPNQGVNIAFNDRFAGDTAMPPAAKPTMGQQPQQMAQAPSAAIPQPIRQGPQVPPDEQAKMKWLIDNGGKNGPALAAAINDRYLPKDQPASVQEYQLYRQQGGTDDYTTWDRKNKTAGATLINTAEGMGAAQQKARIDIDKHAIEDLSKKAVAGRQVMPLLNQVMDLANKTPGGWAGAVSSQVAKGMSALGFEVPEGASNAELLQSITRQMIPGVRDPGSTSNLEQSLYAAAVPGLSQSKEGRIKIAEMTRAQVDRAHDILQIYRQHVGEPDLVDKLKELDNKPIFSKEQRAALDAASGGSAGGNATGGGITPEQAMQELQRRKGGSL